MTVLQPTMTGTFHGRIGLRIHIPMNPTPMIPPIRLTTAGILTPHGIHGIRAAPHGTPGIPAEVTGEVTGKEVFKCRI